MRPDRVVFGAFFALLFQGAAAPEVIVLGGGGQRWEEGGGTIPATVIRTATTVEMTNVPGAVIDFNAEGRDNWIFPKRADPLVNIAVGAASAGRGGSIKSPNSPDVRPQLLNMIDDDGLTALDLRSSSGLQGTTVLGMIVDIDLGARFGVNRFRFFPRNAHPDYPAEQFPHQNDFMRGFEIFVNDGSLETQRDGVPIRETAVIESRNDRAVVEAVVESRYVRHVRLKSLTARGFEIAEFQVFATGFVPEARYVSDIFDFGGRALFGNLRWTQDQVGGSLSSAAIRTRAGKDPQPVEYARIRPGERIAGQRDEEVPWLAADDVEDPELSRLIESRLDNPEVRVRDALAIFENLPLAEQAAMALDEESYRNLGSGEKGVIRDDVRNWTGWSPPHAPTGIVDESRIELAHLGSPIGALSPRRYFQFAIDFTSRDLGAATGIGALAFDVLTPPFADTLIAEIAPRRTGLGETTRFTYALLSRSTEAGSRGFDSMEIDTPLRVSSIGRVTIRGERGGVSREEDFSGIALDDGALPATRGGFTVVEVRTDGFAVTFPPILNGGVLGVEFDCAVLRYGTTFPSRVRRTGETLPMWQEAVAGNAADLGTDRVEDEDSEAAGSIVPGNLSVAVPLADDLLMEVRADPPVVTPNGDGVNDLAVVHYTVTSVTRPSPVEIRVLDLAGRTVAFLYDGEDASGRFARPWDGRDGNGLQVPPGNYLVSIRLGTRAETATGTAVVRVAY